MYGFSRVENRWVIRITKSVVLYSSAVLAILPLPPCLQTFLTTSTTLWEH